MSVADGPLPAIHGNCEGSANFVHSAVAEPTDSIRKHTYRNALDRIEIDSSSATDGVIARLKNHLACEAADGGRARGDHRTPELRNRSVA